MIANGQAEALKPYQIVEQEFACDHTHTSIVKYTQRNGVVVVRRQCQRCGTQVGNNLPKADYNADSLPEWNEDLKTGWWEAKSQRSNELYEQQQESYKRQRQIEQIEWWRRYNLYLNSNHWQQLRRKVIARDHFQCQNCFCRVTDASAHVHHLSYDGYNRLGQSFAFECVTLCAGCHRRFHPENYEQQ